MTGLVYTKDKMVKVLTKTIRNALIISSVTLMAPSLTRATAIYDCSAAGSFSSLINDKNPHTTTNLTAGQSMELAFINPPRITIENLTPLIQTLAEQRPKTDPNIVGMRITCGEFSVIDRYADAPVTQWPPTTGFMTDATPLPGGVPGFKLTATKGSGTKNCNILFNHSTERATWVATTNEPEAYKTKTIQWNEIIKSEYIIHYDGSWYLEDAPPGSYVHGNSIAPQCRLRPLQLEITVTPEIDFGMTTAGTASYGEIVISITSGTDVPSGTYWLHTPDSNSATPINLGGGTVNIIEGTTVLKQHMDYPITSRIIRLNATLNATGATPGPAETPLTVTLRVN